jgi:hypothetical protein
VLFGLSWATICYLYLTRARRSVYASECVEKLPKSRSAVSRG